MSTPVWARPFPGGVADARAREALWRDSKGRLVALDLVRGRRRWQSREALWPLLLDERRAIALAFGPPRVVALALDSDDGAELWRSAALPWPAWAASLPGPTAGLELQAAWLDGQVLLCWRLRELRSGGAPAPRARGEPSVGACRLDAASGRLGEVEASFEPPSAEAALTASDDPSVLAGARLGDVDYRIVQRGAGGQACTVLVAQATTEDRPRWELELETLTLRAPRALPP